MSSPGIIYVAWYHIKCLWREASPWQQLAWRLIDNPRLGKWTHCSEIVEGVVSVRGFGIVESCPEGQNTLVLAAPGFSAGINEVFLVEYITACCSRCKKLDIKNYRLNETSECIADFNPWMCFQEFWLGQMLKSTENKRGEKNPHAFYSKNTGSNHRSQHTIAILDTTYSSSFWNIAYTLGPNK